MTEETSTDRPQSGGSVSPWAGRTLILVATELEAQAFAEHHPVVIVGVGKVNAATATARACVEHRPSMIVNIGTAGALHDDHHVGPFEIGTVIQHDIDGDSIHRLIGHHPSPPIPLAGDGPTLATGDRFIADATERTRLADRAHYVDMEGYAVAAAAQAHGVPVRLIKIVSDTADDDAHRSWSDAVAGASRVLAAWLDDNL